jgi:hypothetical protein
MLKTNRMIDLSLLIDNPELARNIKLEISGEDLLAFGKYLQNNASEVPKEKNLPLREEYLTSKQFIEALQISEVTLWSWDKKGITTPLRVGSQKRYRRSDLEKILINKKSNNQ